MRFSGDKPTVIDGPFAETKELIAGFWIWQVRSMDEAVEWLKRAPFRGGEELEIRQVFEAEDFGDGLHSRTAGARAPARAPAVRAQLGERPQQNCRNGRDDRGRYPARHRRRLADRVGQAHRRPRPIVRDVGLAEDLAQDALVAALEQWPESGVPDNPGAWLMATAKHRAIDLFRRKPTAGTEAAGARARVGDPAGTRRCRNCRRRRSTTISATICCD